MEFKITISRSSDNLVYLRVTDATSGIEFFDAGMSLENFSQCITGLGYVPAEGKVRGLEYVGKVRVTEPRQVLCPLNTYNITDLVAWLTENAQEDGWLLDTYIGRQGSVTAFDGGRMLRYSVTKYVSADCLPQTTHGDQS